MKLHEIAKQAERKYPDPAKGVAWMRRQLEQLADDDELRADVELTACRAAFHEARGVRNAYRRDITVNPKETPEHVCKPGQMTAPKVNVRYQGEVGHGWLDTFIVGNKRLRDCTREDLAIELERCRANAKGWAARERFIRATLEQLKPQQKVADAMKEADVEQIARAAYSSAPAKATPLPAKPRKLAQPATIAVA